VLQKHGQNQCAFFQEILHQNNDLSEIIYAIPASPPATGVFSHANKKGSPQASLNRTDPMMNVGRQQQRPTRPLPP
jgi:hypothetical protein